MTQRSKSKAGQEPKTIAARGGEARAAALTKQARSEIARTAALARWAGEGKDVPARAICGGPNRPLRIGSIEIPCYVLEDGRRVLAQRGLQTGIGLSEGGGYGGARRIAVLMAFLAKKDIDIKDLIARVDSPIKFIPPHGGNPADGYDASILPDICAVIIDAARQGKLQPQQAHLAERASVLQHGFATVGLIALIDEATGYQDIRARDALAKILEKLVAKDLQKWLPTFPPDFYREMFKLRDWPYPPASSTARPGVVAHYTNDLVYDRIAPGLRPEILRVMPKTASGRRKGRMFQMLTPDHGHPKLKEHLFAVVALMKASTTWSGFMGLIDRALPRFGDTRLLPMDLDGTPPASQ